MSDADTPDPFPEGEPELTPVPLERALAARRAPRQRALRGIGAGLLVLLVLLALGGGWAPFDAALATVMAPLLPPAPPPLPPGADLAYLAPDVPWARITVDGHVVAVSPPSLGVAAPLRLARGRHTLRWAAAPFQPQQCVLSVPASASDTCPLSNTPAHARQDSHGNHDSPEARVVLLPEHLWTLSPAQQSALLETMRQALPPASTLLHPSEQYLSQLSGRMTAQAPLRATLTFRLDTSTHDDLDEMGGLCEIDTVIAEVQQCAVDGQACAGLCALPWTTQATWQRRAPAWYAFATTHLSWSYTSLDGRTQFNQQPLDTGSAEIADHLVLLRITYAPGRWQVRAVLGPALGAPIFDGGVELQDDPACAAAEDISLAGISPPTPYRAARFVSGANPAQGCVVTAYPRPLPTPARPPEVYYINFGLIFPANDAARRALRYIPPASPAEQSFIHSVAAYPGQTLPIPNE